ncbi:MAG: hypothetical protein KJ063_12280 [Anaerolineae bacterium]|nr:hypothetical protein [Anaerolineae bacterium]
MKVEIISIGNELLYNDVIDVNAVRATTCLRELQIEISCKVTVGDQQDMIIQAVNNGLQRADVVITIGGLGQDTNDFTRQAIWKLLGIPAAAPAETIPGSQWLDQDESGPYGHLLPHQEKTIIALPGGRRKVAHLLETAVVPFLKARQEQTVHYQGDALIHTAGLVESDIRQRLESIQLQPHEKMVLHSFAGQTDIRLWIESSERTQVDVRLNKLRQEVYTRLGDQIYGEGETRLEQVVLKMLHQRHLSLIVAEEHTNQAIQRLLTPFIKNGTSISFLPVTTRIEMNNLVGLVEDEPGVELTRWSRQMAQKLREKMNCDLGLVVVNQVLAGGMQLMITLASPKGISLIQRTFGGHPDNIKDWTLTLSLVLLRRWLLANPELIPTPELYAFSQQEQVMVG